MPKDIAKQEFDTVFLITNYVQVDLKRVLNSVGKGTIITKSHAKTLMYNALNGLNFLHLSGIIHRDIKPGNMLMGKSCEVYYCDFGLARLVPQDSEDDVADQLARINAMTRTRDKLFPGSKLQ